MTSSEIMFSVNVTLVSETTLLNATSPLEYEAEWMASYVLTIIFILFGFYVLASLSVYEYHMIWNKHINKTVKLHGTGRVNWMRWLCLAGSVFVLTRFVLELLEVHNGNSVDYICNGARQAKAVLLSGAFTCIYLVLWLRQRKFYQSPALQHLSGMWIRFFSASVIFLMITANAVTIGLYLFSREYESSPRGCILKYTAVWSKLPGLLLLTFTCSFQIVVVGLLIYPLYMHRTFVRSTGERGELKVIKRVAIEAFVTVITTGLCNVVVVTALSGGYGLLRQLVYDFDVSICMLAVIHSFKDWRERLCPCLAKQKRINQTKIPLTSVQSNLTSVSSLAPLKPFQQAS